MSRSVLRRLAIQTAAPLLAAFALASVGCGSGKADNVPAGGTGGTPDGGTGSRPDGGTGGDGYVAPAFDAPVITTAERLLGQGDSTNVGAAMALAGFDQVSDTGTVIVSGIPPRQGVTFERSDAAIIASAMRQGPALSIDDLVGGWAAMGMGASATDADRKAKTDAMRAALVADLRKAAVSSSSTSRFWAQLIVQLGRSAPVSYDLLDPAVPGDSLLDPVQTAFLSYRFAAELWAAAQAAAGKPLRVARRPVLSAPATPRPCTMTDTEGTILDGAALGITQLMGKLLEEAGKNMPGAEKYAKFTEQANAALLVVKVLWTFIAFEAHVTSDNSLLVRTRDANPGDDALFKASFRMNTGNFQVVNCIRPALNTLGIDFDLPPDGPIAGAGVDWDMGTVYDRIQAHKSIVRFKEWPLGHHTDANGEDTADVEGSPKVPAITGAFMPDFRLVPIRAKVSLKDTKMLQDIIDAIDVATTSNPAVATLSFLYEWVIRARSMVFMGSYVLPVQDHLPLANVTISAQLTGHAEGTVTAGGKGSQSIDSMVQYIAKAKQGAKPLTFVQFNGSGATGITQAIENSVRTFDYKGTYDDSSACVCAPGNAVTQSSASLNGVDATDDKEFTLYANLEPDGSYRIDLRLGAAVLRGAYHYASSGCGDPEETKDNELIDATLFGPVTLTGKIDMTRSGGKLEGTVPVHFQQPVPDQLGGFYQGGAAQTSFTVSGEVHYSIDYILQNVTFPLSPPAEKPVQAQEQRPLSSVPASASPPGAGQLHLLRASVACW